TRRIPVETVQGGDQIAAVNIVSDLLASISEDGVRLRSNRAFHQIRQETVQFRSRMGGPRQAAGPKAGGLHSEITSIFLYENVSCQLRSTEDGMFRCINGHCFVDSFFERVARLDLPPCLTLYQGEQVWSVAIHFVGGHEYEHSRGTELAGGFEENKCPISVDAEVGVWVACRPVVRRLRRGVDHESNIAAIFPEYSFDLGAVANIGIEMPVAIPVTLLQALPVPGCGSGIAEKESPHVIVNANDLKTFFRVKVNRS